MSIQVPFAAIVEPNVLFFPGPFTHASTAKLMLYNPGDQRMAFKWKTAQPRRYVVQPGKGFLEAKQSLEVTVRKWPVADTRSFDATEQKFAVQSLVAAEMDSNVNLLFRNARLEDIHLIEIAATFEGVATTTAAKTVESSKSLESVISDVQPVKSGAAFKPKKCYSAAGLLTNHWHIAFGLVVLLIAAISRYRR